MTISQDASTPSPTQASANTASTVTSASFSPPANSFVVILYSLSFKTATGSGPTVTVKDSLSNTFTAGPAVYDTTRDYAGVFTRYYSTAPGSITITATRSVTSQAGIELTPIVLDGAASTQSAAAAAVNFSNIALSPVNGTLKTTAPGSWVLFASAIAASGQTLTANGVTTTLTGTTLSDTTDGVYLAQGKQTSATSSPGSTTLGWTDTTAAAFAWAALEIVPATSAVSGADTAHGAEGERAGPPAGGVIADLLPSAIGSGVLFAGSPGGPGGPGGSVSPGFNQATGQGSGWEITVLAAPDFHQMLALVPGKMVTGIQFVKQLDDKGSGTVTLDMDDPWWTAITLPNGQPGHYLLDWEHVWQVWQDGVLRMEFLGETITEQLVDASEQRVVTITGPGTIATLAWAAAMPPGFPNIIYKLDAITDGFSEINTSGQAVLDTGLWNASSASGLALNPLGSCQIVGSPSTTFLGTTVFDGTETLISAQVNPIVSPDYAGNILDGSQLTQFYIQDVNNTSYYALIGMSSGALYAQYGGPAGVQTHTIASASAYATAMANNYGYSYWQISESGGWFYFWTSPDGQNWTKQWEIFHTGWDPTEVGFYVAAKYDVANTEYATITGLNSNVTTSSLAGALYFNQPIMSVWLQELQAAQARGTVPFVAVGELSTGTDSFGNAWSDNQSVQIANGTDLYSLLQGHTSMINADFIMQPGFRLQVGIPETGSITLGTDRSATVIFRDGMDCSSRIRTRARNQIQNLLAVINTDGRTVTTSNPTSESEYGQREGWVQAATQVTQADLQVVAAAAVEQNASEVLSWTLQVAPYMPGRTVFTGFDAGDWIGLERPDFSAVDKVRVMAIAVSVAPDGSETHELTLVSYIQWLQEQLTYIATKLGGGFISANGTTPVANNGALTNLNQPTVFAPTLDGLGGVQTGGQNGNAPLVFDPVTGQWIPAGTVNPVTGTPTPVQVAGSTGTVTISPTGGSGGTPAVTVSQPPTTPADVGTATAAPATTMGIFTTTITDSTGTTRNIIGAQTDGTFTSQDVNGAAPATPDTPTAAGTLNGLLVTWDGKLAGAAPLSDFLWTEVHMSTSSGFTPSTATLQGTINTAATFPVTGLTVGTTYYVKLVARNTSGVASSASAQASGVPTALTASLIGQMGVLNSNPYFAGGDGSTWAGVSGTFSVSSTPPSGNPYTYAGLFTISTSGVGAAAKESGDPFPVVPGAQYLVTAWVYTGTTSAVIGFDFFNSSNTLISGTYTQTFTVTANTWTSVTAVITAPATAHTAYLRIAPADGVSNSIYFEAILALPQVPGSLIQAGTVTATQIAAATITAAQIATGTITATQIQSGTITATQIQSGTITSAQIAAGTITASNIQSGTITAGLLASGIVVANIVNGTTITGATIIADGTNGELLVYSGTPASGNLIAAVSGAAGSDSFGNSWVAGLDVTAGSITGTSINGGTITGADIVADGSNGLVAVYSGTPASGNLINALAGASGSDSFGNSYPEGMFSQQLTLENQSSAPSSFSGASVFYSSVAGRPRYVSSAGTDAVLDRSTINTSQFSVGNTQTYDPCSAQMFYLANEANGTTEYEIECSGMGTWESGVLEFTLSTGTGIQWGTFVIGASLGITAGDGFVYRVIYTMTILTTGTSGTVHVSSVGLIAVDQSGINALTSNTINAGNEVNGLTFDTTIAHTLQVYAQFTQNIGGQTMTTYRTRMTRRN